MNDGEAADDSAGARLIDFSTTDRYYVEDSTDPRLSAFATVDHRGVLSISLRTVIGDRRSAVLRGREQFSRILAHFGRRVAGIKGNWQFGTNLDEVNRLTAEGASLEDAAGRTWTGRRAAEAGFTEVTVLSFHGGPGSFSSVQVLFTRPGLTF